MGVIAAFIIINVALFAFVDFEKKEEKDDRPSYRHKRTEIINLEK